MIVLDTNVLSELMKPQFSEVAEAWVEGILQRSHPIVAARATSYLSLTLE